ncbi:MAG: transposase [Microcoleaceae cyanobacterium]
MSCVPLQQGLRHLQTTFNNFFAGRAKSPNFKKKRSGGSAEFTKSAFKFKAGQVYLAKYFEPLPIRWSGQLRLGCEPSIITVKLDLSGRWFVSLRINDNTNQKLEPVNKKVGIDLGISSFFSTYDRVKVTNPKHFNKLYKKLPQPQKSLSRKVKDSKNREKARIKVATIQARIADSRRDKVEEAKQPSGDLSRRVLM